jgi:hypothetical protein
MKMPLYLLTVAVAMMLSFVLSGALPSPSIVFSEQVAMSATPTPDDPPVSSADEDAISGWIANQEELDPPPTPTNLPPEPPPETGFSSWAEMAAYMDTGGEPGAAGSAWTDKGPAGGDHSVDPAGFPGVGGVAELPAVDASPTTTSEPSGGGQLLSGVIIGSVAALGAVAVGAFRFLRRRG